MTARHRVLDGLPPYGPMPAQFSVTGQGMHREGFVVEFTPPGAPSWIGNFQRGMTSLDVLIASRGNTTVTVIAGGQAYVVEPAARSCVRAFGGQIEHAFALADRTVFSNGLWLEATDGERLLWRTRRLSWDGMMDVRVDGERIVGNAYDPMNDEWTPFSVEVANGEAVGGSYPLDLPT
ncbi:MAG TPA: hypothetical protein VM580_21290 [Labilithrix sp.]|nr:hypothetical protein [Labilithrix sp.]